jgi:hypothetical protein
VAERLGKSVIEQTVLGRMALRLGGKHIEVLAGRIIEWLNDPINQSLKDSRAQSLNHAMD